MSAPCWFCLEPVDKDDETAYRKVTSWVTGPKLQSPVLREQTGIYAHKACIDLVVSGQAPDQEPLFEVPEDEPELCVADTLKGLCGWKLTPQGDCLNGDNHAF